MELIERSEIPLKADYRESLSYKSALTGSFFIFPWGYFIFFYMYENFPVIVFAINALIWPIFAYINIREYRALFSKNRFLLLIKNEYLYLPLNYQIKNPSAAFDCFLKINLQDDIDKLVGIDELRIVPQIFNHRLKIVYKKSKYIKLNLKHKIEDSILEKHKLIANAQGFTGSPVYLEDNIIEYYLDISAFKLKKVLHVFLRKGLGDGKILKIKRDRNSRDYALKELKRLVILKDIGFVQSYGKYLVDKKILSKSEVQEIVPSKFKAF